MILCYQLTLRVKHFYTNRELGEVRLDIAHWVVVTGRRSDMGLNVLNYFFRRKVVAAHS
jgi:hypothetical protein